MSWLEMETIPGSQVIGRILGDDGQLYKELFMNRRRVTNDPHFFYYSEFERKYIPGGIHRWYAVWIDRTKTANPEQISILHIERRDLKIGSRHFDPANSHYLLKFGDTRVVMFDGKDEKWDCIFTTSIDKLDFFLKEFYGLYKSRYKMEKGADLFIQQGSQEK